MPNEPKPAAQKRPRTERRENAQGDHEGSAHTPDEFDVLNPEKQIPPAKKPTSQIKDTSRSG